MTGEPSRLPARFEPAEYRTLGSTGLRISPLGLGTVKLGRDRQVKYPSPFVIPDDTQAAALLACAQECGINLIDTAPAYGTSEERLGVLLDGQRDQWIIVTKVGEEFDNASGQSRFDFSAAHIRTSIERSLRRLRTEFLDCVLIHSDGNDEQILCQSEAIATLESLKDKGLLRSFGLSAKTVDGARAAVRCCDCLMLPLNRSHIEMQPVIEEACARGVGVLIKKALQSGHHAHQAREALGFVLTQPGVSSAIVGTINPDHLRANVAAARWAIAGIG